MTRKLMYDAIKAKLEEEGLEATEENKAAVDAAVCAALEYILNFGLETAEALAIQKAYSELLVAGVFINKIKGLMR